jgi:rhodanese-related sulfurtransferase
VAQGKALPVDIRDAASYSRYRIPGAIHIPAEELASRTEELQPFDGRIRILYGRSEEAKEWSEKLQADGVQVGFLSGGFLHWEADGLEVERG